MSITADKTTCKTGETVTFTVSNYQNQDALIELRVDGTLVTTKSYPDDPSFTYQYTPIKTANYIIKNSKKYNYAGQQVK